MKSIVVTYPYFQSLPKGLKMLLVESEGFFFRELGSAPKQVARVASKATRMDRSVVGWRETRFGSNTSKSADWPDEKSFSA